MSGVRICLTGAKMMNIRLVYDIRLSCEYDEFMYRD